MGGDSVLVVIYSGGDFVLVAFQTGGCFVLVYKKQWGGFCPGGILPYIHTIWSTQFIHLLYIQDDEKGCVKVIKDMAFSWMTPEDVVLDKPARTHPLGLILEPTRELAIQVKNHLLAAAKYTDISVCMH